MIPGCRSDTATVALDVLPLTRGGQQVIYHTRSAPFKTRFHCHFPPFEKKPFYEHACSHQSRDKTPVSQASTALHVQARSCQRLEPLECEYDFCCVLANRTCICSTSSLNAVPLPRSYPDQWDQSLRFTDQFEFTTILFTSHCQPSDLKSLHHLVVWSTAFIFISITPTVSLSQSATVMRRSICTGGIRKRVTVPRRPLMTAVGSSHQLFPLFITIQKSGETARSTDQPNFEACLRPTLNRVQRRRHNLSWSTSLYGHSSNRTRAISRSSTCSAIATRSVRRKATSSPTLPTRRCLARPDAKFATVSVLLHRYEHEMLRLVGSPPSKE